MLSCKRATELIEKRLVVGLSSGEKIRLKMHMGMCEACQTYEKQSIIMDSAVKKYAEGQNQENVKLSPKRKDKIINSLD